MIIGSILPYIYAVFLVTKSFERRYEARRNGVLHCRDRRPRRSVFRTFYPQHDMNMIWHDHVTLNRQVIVKVVQLIDVFICDLSVFCQFDLRTVEDAGPYNAREDTLSLFRTYREKHGLVSIIVRTFQPSDLAIFQFVHFHQPFFYTTNQQRKQLFSLLKFCAYKFSVKNNRESIESVFLV